MTEDDKIGKFPYTLSVDYCWAVSLVGRAPRLQRGGRRFESGTVHPGKCYDGGEAHQDLIVFVAYCRIRGAFLAGD